MKKQQSSSMLLITVIFIAVVVLWAGAASYWWMKRSACPDLAGWGNGEKASTSLAGSRLTGVTAVSWHCYDRVVINLGDSSVRYNVRYADSIATQGRGTTLELAGGAKLAIDVDATSYNSAGQTVYPATVGQTLPGVNVKGYSVIKDARWGGSFEGQSTIGLGVKSKLPFRVISDGNQLTIDIAHKE